MATLSVQDIARDTTGTVPSYAAATSGGDEWTNTGAEFYFIKNGGGGSINVTFVTQATTDGLAVTDLVVAVSNGVDKMIGPFPVGIYNDTGGKLQVTYSGVSSVTVGVFKI